MRPIDFTVPAVPIAQPRQRHAVRHGKGGRVFSSNYTPTDDPVNAYKAAVKLAFAATESGAPITEPLRVELMFVFGRPKGHYGSGKNIGTIKKSSPMWHTSTPDTDNLIKSTLDALNELMYRDDSQVCQVVAVKRYVVEGESPHVQVFAEPFGS